MATSILMNGGLSIFLFPSLIMMWARLDNQMVVVGDDQSYANYNVMCQAKGIDMRLTCDPLLDSTPQET